MSSAIAAIKADREELLALCRQLDDSAWAKDSGCPGWSVRDVVSHMACSFWLAVDPANLADSAGQPAERAADLYVEARRGLTPEQVLTDYELVSSRGLDFLAEVQDQHFAVPLGDVGTYPASVVPTAFAFEHYVHIRCDLFPPDGPLDGEPPASDGLRLAPTLDWVEAALPQQNMELIAGMGNAVEIRLTGTAGRRLRVGGGDVAAHIICDSPAFVRWITQRATWEGLGVEVKGDPSALEIVRQLRVF